MNSIIRCAQTLTKMVSVWLTLAILVTACGGGGGSDPAPAVTLVLAGDPAQKASTALQDKRSARVDKADIVKGHLLTQLFVVLKAEATVGQVNAAAQAAGASAIAFSTPNSLLLTLLVPRQAGIAEMHALARRLRAQPGILFAWPEREFKTSELPKTASGQPVSPLDLSHLLPTRFPQAWNAIGARGRDLLCGGHEVHVYVWDKFGDSGARPTFFNQIPSSNFVFDDVGGNADESGHGFDVASTLAAGFDAQRPTGANPFDDCVIIHQIDAFGRGMIEALSHALETVQRETASRFILNISINFAEDFCGPVDQPEQLCDAATIRTTPVEILRGVIQLRAILAARWASHIGTSDLGERMLIAQAAGNVDFEPGGFLARNYRGFRSASFSSPAALATHIGQLPALVRDPSLWRSETDPTLPDITFPADNVTDLVDLLAAVGATTSIGAQNLLIVDSGTDAEAFADVRASEFNFLGADVRAVGENVKLFDIPLATGTSFSAPQVAGLASYLWVLSDGLRNQPVAATVDLIKRTSRTSANSPTVAVIDAYAATQSLDLAQNVTAGVVQPIRRALVDVNGDGNFDHLDLLQFQAAYGLTDPSRPSIPSTRDYSRFDLNGDGFTGGIITDRFDLDASGIGAGSAANSVTLSIEGYEVTMNEAALSDIQILCFYAYSNLYATSPVNRDEALLERTRMLGPDQCVGARLEVSLPAQISTSASLNATIQVPIGNGQFGPGANLLVDFTPSSATVSPTSGRTDANGAIATTVTPNAGSTSVSVMVVARADAGTTALAQKTVSATVQAAVYVGGLVESTNQPSFTQCDSLNFCITNSASGRDEYSNLRFVLQANGTFVASGTFAHAVRGDTTTTDGCHSTITETGTGTVTAFDGSISRPKGSIRGIGTTTRTISEIACRGNPAFSNTSTKTTTFTASSNFLTPVFSGGTLVQLIWNGSSTDQTNTTFMQQGEVHLVP